MEYYAYLFGSEHKGSVHNILQTKNLVLETCAQTHRVHDLFSYIDLEFLLSETGLKNIETILSVVGSYIEMFKKNGPSEEIYSELLQLNEISFKYSSKKDEYDFVCDLTERLDLEEKELLLRTDVTRPFNKKLVKEYEEYFSFENMIVLQTGKELEIKETAIEKYFQIPYENIHISKVYEEHFKSLEYIEKVEIPITNKFIAKNFDLVKEKENYYTKKTDGYLLSFLRAEQFNSPKASVRIDVCVDASLHYSNIENLLYFKLWSEYLNIEISDLFEEASNASTSIRLKASEKAL